MKQTFLIITSIAKQDHPVLKILAEESLLHNISLVIVGDTKSPKEFKLNGCDYFSIERQKALDFKLAKILPSNHYARKNLGYLVAMSKGAEIIIETDDDNLPLQNFWDNRTKTVNAHLLNNKDWVNVYKYFTDIQVWPRGFSLENIKDKLPELEELVSVECPIQQGLADKNPDVDAIYRLILPLQIIFNKAENIALGDNSFCPFNSQNTTWFKEAFPLLYLPSYCSFRMTDIWRSFVAQRIAWTCGWQILFHQSSMWQQRNDHNLIADFCDEVPGYLNNAQIYKSLKDLELQNGIDHLAINMIRCYEKLIDLKLVSYTEIDLLKAWLKDIINLSDQAN